MRWLPIPILATVAIYFLLYVPPRLEVEELRAKHADLMLEWARTASERAWVSARLERQTTSVLPAIRFGALPAPLLIWFGLWVPGWFGRVRHAQEGREGGGKTRDESGHREHY